MHCTSLLFRELLLSIAHNSQMSPIFSRIYFCKVQITSLLSDRKQFGIYVEIVKINLPDNDNQSVTPPHFFQQNHLQLSLTGMSLYTNQSAPLNCALPPPPNSAVIIVMLLNVNIPNRKNSSCYRDREP